MGFVKKRLTMQEKSEMQCTSCGMNIQIGEAKCSSCGTPVQTNTSEFSPYLPGDDAIPYIPHEPVMTTSPNEASRTTLSTPHASRQSHDASSLPDYSPQRPHHPVYTVLLLTTLVLLIIMGGGTTYYAIAFHPGVSNAHATVVAQGVLAAQARATATANANSPQSIYNQITSKSPTFEDPLDGQHIGLWGNQGNGDTGCAFANGAYHIRFPARTSIFYCLTPGNEFSNFVFQVQVTIIKGYDSGILFRANDPEPSAYFFAISYNGLYSLNIAEGPQHGAILAFGRSPAIKVGFNQPNLLSVMAHGSNIDLFINKQFVKRVQDETYAAGAIGLVADSTIRVPSDTAFSNVQLWNLP
jgi:hypothetical protein